MKALEDSPTPPAEEAREPLRVSRSDQVAQAIVLAVALSVPALVCMRMAIVGDADIWWHLRTAQWILAHHSVPHTDPFSRLGAGTPWAAYSWLYELLVLQCFQRFGIAGIPAYTIGMVLAVTAAIYHLIKRLQPDFLVAVLLTCVAGLSLMRLFTPRSWLFSILFFTLQLDILLHARKTEKTRELLWLPVIYALWANLHIQFFDGLVVLGIAVGEAIASRWWTSARTQLRPAWLGGIAITCVLATLINPFGWHIYEIGYHAATQPGVLYFISEFHALEFRTMADYCMLVLALAAAGAVAARSVQIGQRRIPLFEILLLAFAAIVSFRCGRDMWIMVIIASALLAPGFGGSEKDRRPLAAFAVPLIVVAIGLILFIGSRVTHMDDAHLRAQLADHMPVRAVQVVQEKGYSGPLYNNFDWGGYLIWKLRMPVSVDGRADLYGDKRLARSFATWGGAPDWASDPDLQSAKLVIGPVQAPLTQLLRMDPRFELAFEDKIAAVFVARSTQAKPAISSGEQP